MKRPVLLVLLVVCAATALAQRANMSGIKICIDPGHGGNNPANDRYVVPDPGTEFWESESNFQTALHVKSLLEAKGATVLLTRNTNTYPTDADPSLSARVEFANANNVHWFHSIHTNATGLPLGQNVSTNYTLMLIREKRPGGVYSSTGNGLGVPEMQESWDISLIMGPKIVSKLRTQRTTQYLDWTFYGGTNGGFSLGVLRGLSMPGQLSEAAFHDYYPQTRRLMNLRYLKMEAYALRDAFLQYFGVPADTMCIVAGILSEIGSGKMVDAARVRILPGNIVTTGDNYRNGFYMFDDLSPGVHTIRFETPGYRVDSVQVTLSPGETRFVDRQVETTAGPVITSSSPARNDTAFSAAGQIQIVFSKTMDTASVRAAFSITPSVPGILMWSNSLTTLTFKPDSVVLPFNTFLVLRIEGSARSQSGFLLDGNGDGTVGDAFQLGFRTQPADVWFPALVSAFAPNGSTGVSPSSVLNFTYDEPLNPSTVNTSNIVIQQVGGSIPSRTFEYHEANGRGGFTIYPQGGLQPGKSYRIRISGVTDLAGNAIPATNPLWTFTVGPEPSQTTSIEDFTASVSAWWQPATSGSTTGIDSATFTYDSLVTLKLFTPPVTSGRLTYRWNTSTATNWLIREYLSTGPGRSLTWTKEGKKLQVYIFGDGNGTEFRFAVDDSVDAFPDGTSANHEVSPWIPVNWVGWRLVEWDLTSDSVGTWLGNGKLEGMLRFDSFQLRRPVGSQSIRGAVNFTRLQVATKAVVFAEEIDPALPGRFDLSQNYPNPFNPATTIGYQIPSQGIVTLKVFDILGRELTTLVNEVQRPGTYQVRWDGRNDRGESVASGVYLYQLRAGSSVITRRMLLMK